jgi:predicted ATP-grasp superfamily ATP-dependent carboligase
MAREGLLMLQAILEDFLFPTHLPVTLVDRKQHADVFATFLDWAEAVLLIAPETDGVLAYLCAQVEGEGKFLLGSTSKAVVAATDKVTTDSRFRAGGIPTARTRVIPFDDEPTRHVATFGYPAVVKPVDGAGGEGVFVVHRPAETSAALRRLRRVTRHQTFLCQQYVAGIPASLSCLSDGGCVLPLTLNTQYIHMGNGLIYRGGTIDIDHPSRSAAFGMAKDLHDALPGLRGYFGVNPRLTTSYIGLRRAFSTNLAGAILTSALGQLPTLPTPRGPLRFFVDRRRRISRAKG